jgi:SAM-dependent methyltransferase
MAFQMNYFLLVYYFFRSLVLRGIRNTFKIINYESEAEKKYNIQTAGVKVSNSTDFFHYQGANYWVLEQLIKESLTILPDASYTDIGCGKGRVCFVAEKMGYRRVTGIDLDKELIDTAKANAAIINSRAEFIHCNALEHKFKNETAVYFLFNPFSDSVLKQVLKKIKESTQSKTLIIYMNPTQADVFKSLGIKTFKELKTNRYLEANFYFLNA